MGYWLTYATNSSSIRTRDAPARAKLCTQKSQEFQLWAWTPTSTDFLGDLLTPPLTPPYDGPFRVVDRLDDRRYVIRINDSDKTISVDRLKPAFLPEEDVDQNTGQPDRPAELSTNITPANIESGIDSGRGVDVAEPSVTVHHRQSPQRDYERRHQQVVPQANQGRRQPRKPQLQPRAE